MRTLPRTVVLALGLSLFVGLAGCGDSDSGSSGPSGSSTSGSSGSSDAREQAEAPSGSGTGVVPSAEGSLDLADYRAGIGQDDLTDSDEFITATQVLGEVDGYLTTNDELVVTGADGEELQYLCVAKDQLNLDTYTVIVLQADGALANC